MNVPLCRNYWTLPIRHACNLNWTEECTCFTHPLYFLKTFSFAPDPRNQFQPSLCTWSNIVARNLQTKYPQHLSQKRTTSFYVPSINLRNDFCFDPLTKYFGCVGPSTKVCSKYTFIFESDTEKHFDEMFDGHFKAICLHFCGNPKIRCKQ